MDYKEVTPQKYRSAETLFRNKSEEKNIGPNIPTSISPLKA